MAFFIVFNAAPADKQFLLSKCPKFDSKEDAFRALYHYEFEFGAYGNVMDKHGMVREDIVPVQTSADYGF